MSSVTQARLYLEQAIGPVPAGTYLKTLFPRVARDLGVTVRRIETIWQETARRVDADELEQFKALAAKARRSAETAHAHRYEAIATALEAVDADFHRADIARYRGMARSLRGAAGHRAVAR